MSASFISVYRKYCGWIYGAIALCIALAVLFGGGEIGLSNNGDFSRVMQASSLTFGQNMPSYTYVSEYPITVPEGTRLSGIAHILFSADGWETYPSVHVLLVRFAVAVQFLLGATVFHMGGLGCLYALLYAGAIGSLCQRLQLRRLWADLVLKAVFLIVECDIGYLAYFNSFFSEPLQHIALLWFVSACFYAFRAERTTILRLALCCAAAILYGWAKFFNIPVALLMIAAVTGAAAVRSRRGQLLIPGAVAAALLLGIWASIPSWMDRETTYNAIFYGILRDTTPSEARSALADMGLPEELAAWRDTNYYTVGAVSSMQEQGLWEPVSEVGKADLVRFYLTHPGRFLDQARLSAMHSGLIRPWYLANRGAGWPLMTYSNRMSLWSRIRSAAATDRLWVNVLVAVVLSVLMCLYFPGRRRVRWLIPLLILCALAYECLLPVILNGEGDFAKHLFAYGEMFDLLLLGGFLMLLNPPQGVRPVLFRSVVLLTAISLVLPPLLQSFARIHSERASHNVLEKGAYVSMGSFGGEDLLWLVTDLDGDGAALWCVNADLSLAFDDGGGNDWRESSLRTWLNSDFLDCFSDAERALLRVQENEVILPNTLRDEATQGDLEFGCSHLPLLCARGSDRAYQAVMTDFVTLPDVEMVAAAAREKQPLPEAEFWLETPYCPSSVLTRYISAEGYVLFGSASVEKAVMPVICVALPAAISGAGTLADPFIL